MNYDELKWKDQPLDAANGESIQETPPMTGKQPLPMNGESTALLVVDVQPEYWTNCHAVRKDFPEFPQNLARTVATCRKQKAKIIWVRADYRYRHSPWLAQFERLNSGKRPDTRSELPCDPDSDDFAWEEFATPEGNEVIIAKTSWDSTSNTALMDVLRVSGVNTVLVCGLITSVCVQHSAFSIFEAGYRTILVEDACGDRGRARHDAALALYGDYMYEIYTSRELENKERGLQAAKPRWITLDSIRQIDETSNRSRSISRSRSPSPEVFEGGTQASSARKRKRLEVIHSIGE
jgi:maleamate amidohydrolase